MCDGGDGNGGVTMIIEEFINMDGLCCCFLVHPLATICSATIAWNFMLVIFHIEFVIVCELGYYFWVGKGEERKS